MDLNDYGPALHQTNSQYALEKLRSFNFPLLRNPISGYHVEQMKEELNHIEESLIRYKSYLESLLPDTN